MSVIVDNVEFISSIRYNKYPPYHLIPMYVGALSLHGFRFLVHDLRPLLVLLILFDPE